MISKMRSMAPTIMLVILVSFVIGTIFFDWGMNRGSNVSRMTTAGKVNGKEIPLTYFDRELNAERQKQERQGDGAHDAYQSHLLPRQLWERVVNQRLMKDFYRKVDMNASADEIFDYLKRNPLPGIDTASAFQTNGQFDTAKYAAFLSNPESYNQYSWLRDLEQYIGDVVLAQKLEMLLSAPLSPTKSEIEYMYRAEHEKAKYEYAFVRGDAFAADSSKITAAMIADYYTAHRDSFVTGEKSDLYFVMLPKKSTPADERTYYDELLEIKSKIMARKADARTEAFAEEAKIYSDDESNAQHGGDLGTIQRGAMVPEFDSAAFALDSATVSDPVKTRFGYHLVYVEKKTKVNKTEQVKVRHILRKIVPTMETIDALTAQADSLRGAMLDGGFLKAAGEAAKRDSSIVFDSTGLFERNALIPKIGYVSGLGRFVYGAEGQAKDAVSERLENSDGIYLFAIKGRISKGFLPLEAATPRIQGILVEKLRNDSARAFAEQWAKRVGDTMPLAALSNADSAHIGSGVTDTVTRMIPVGAIGAGSKVSAVAFTLPAGKRSGLIEENGSYYLVRPLWKEPAAVSIPWESPDVSMISSRIMGELKQRIYYNWYMDYKNKQEIVSNIDKIYLD